MYIRDNFFQKAILHSMKTPLTHYSADRVRKCGLNLCDLGTADFTARGIHVIADPFSVYFYPKSYLSNIQYKHNTVSSLSTIKDRQTGRKRNHSTVTYQFGVFSSLPREYAPTLMVSKSGINNVTGRSTEVILASHKPQNSTSPTVNRTYSNNVYRPINRLSAFSRSKLSLSPLKFHGRSASNLEI